MQKGPFGNTTTIFISTAVITVIVLIGLVTFRVATEIEKDRQLAGLSASPYVFNPNFLSAPGAGILKRESGNSTGCEGIIFRAAANGTRYVRESDGGRYYAAEVNNRFGVYILNYGYLLKIENSSLDTHTFRKLRYALYHCDGSYTQSGLRIAVSSPENIQA